MTPQRSFNVSGKGTQQKSNGQIDPNKAENCWETKIHRLGWYTFLLIPLERGTSKKRNNKDLLGEEGMCNITSRKMLTGGKIT